MKVSEISVASCPGIILFFKMISWMKATFVIVVSERIFTHL